MKISNKVFTLILAFSIMLGNMNLSAGFAAENNGNENKPLAELNETTLGLDIPVSNSNNSSNEEEQQASVLPVSNFTELQPNDNNLGNAVSEVLANISVTEDVYGDKPRGKFLVRFKSEYQVNIPSVSESVYKEPAFNQSVGIMTLDEDSSTRLNSEIGYKLDLYNVKSLESVNSLSMELNANEVNQLLSNPIIASIEEDKPIRVASDTLTEVENKSVKESSQTIPWGIHSIGSYMLQERNGAGTESVKVAVFDTGIANHPDLNVAGGISFDDSSNSYSDNKGHGTHIAGTIAATNNSIGVIGVAPSAQIYSVKVIDSLGGGYTSAVIQGIEWAIQNKIDIINMSFVSSQYSESLHDEIKRAKDAGIIIVAASGNNGLGEDTIQYPAKYPEVVAVGAVDASHHRADFSSTGNELDLMGPGFGIISTTMNGDYGVSSGTSNAAAHVTGAAALLWAHHRSWTGQEVIQKLYDTATPLGEANETGKGIVNVAKAEEVIPGTIAPLSDENLSGLNTVLPSKPKGEIETASYDLKNNGATINPGESVTVSLKLEGDRLGENPHQKIIVEVTSASNPNQIIATQTILNPNLDVDIPYTWSSSSLTPTGTYHIKYRYPALSTGNFDDTFIIYVSQPGIGSDTYEPNDTFLTAKIVQPGNSYISYISSSSDIDYYKLTANKSGQISIDLKIPSSVDYEMDIYNDSGVQVGESSNGTGIAESIDFEVAETKSYYIKIAGFSGQFSSLPYTLTLSNIESQPFKAPTGLEVVPYSNSIKLTWDTMPDATSYLLRVNGQEVGSSQTALYTFTELEALTGYKLEVAAVYAGGKSGYASIQASTTIPELIVYKPQDIDQVAGKSQLYSFKPATTGIYRIYTGPFQGSGGSVDTELGIYSSIQLTKLIAGNDDADDTTFSEVKVSLVGGQTYYVKVSGFDTTPLRARITAEVISSTIPYILLDESKDINEQTGSSNVYVFVPPNNGKFRVGTSRYNGSASSKLNDTELTVFSDADMSTSITNGYNDDKGDSTFSEVVVNLSAGIPYYVRVNEVSKGKVYARLSVTSAGQTAFNSLKLGVPVDLSKPSGEEAYLQFTPSSTGKYRFFTANYNGLAQLNDTNINLYADPELESLIDSNDDIKDYRPYGELFSKLEVNLTAGQTYYLVVSSFGSTKGLQAQLTVENYDQSSHSSAQAVPFAETVTSDNSGNPLEITSLYDVDYYKFELTNPEEVSLYLSEGKGVIEDAKGNLRGNFEIDGENAFELDAGIYYLRIEQNPLHTNSQVPVWNFTKYSYEFSVDINVIEYTHGNYGDLSMLRALKLIDDDNLDATPGSNDAATVQYNNKAQVANLHIEIKLPNTSVVIYRSTFFSDNNKTVPIRWTGEVNVNSYGVKENPLIANYGEVYGQVKYWAKTGPYKLFVYRLDGKKKKDIQTFTLNVFNDPVNKLNVVPAPYKTYKGKPITSNDIKTCEKCMEYYDRYVYNPSSTGSVPSTGYEIWFRDMYGSNGITQFWQGSAKLITCDNKAGKELVTCMMDNIGMIPFLGEGADAVSGVIYLVDGKYGEALLSAGSMVPIVGAFVPGTKKALPAFKKLKQSYKNNPCGCLPEGTLITTKDGDRPIEKIKVGDLVLAKDTDTGVQAYKPVEQLFNYESDEVYTIHVGETPIGTTGNHPFWVKGKGWIPADELSVGNELEMKDGSLQKISAITLSNESTSVYNFTVTDFHTYYISELGILTHNLQAACKIDNYTTKVKKGRVTANKGTPSQVLTAEMEAATGMKKPDGWDAHHIVPAGDGRFDEAVKLREIFTELKIDVNSSANGVYLPKQKGSSTTIIDGQTMSTHNGGHAQSYYEFVLRQLEPVKKDPVKVLERLDFIREELLFGRLKIGNISN